MALTNGAQLSEKKQPALTKGLLGLLCVASGLCVANLYYIQPLLADIALDFGVTSKEVGRIATVCQIGYGLGLFLFIPLGDIKERKSLILSLLGVVTVALVAAAVSTNLIMLGVSCFIFSLTTVIPQLIVPLTAQLAEPQKTGQAMGIVLSGLFTGIVLARTVSGIIGGLFGWRSIFWLAAVLMLLLTVTLKISLPEVTPDSSGQKSYPQLLKSLGTLFLTQSKLRKACLFGAMIFGSFSTFWSTIAFFLKDSPYYFSTQTVGLVGLLSLVGAFYTPLAGRLVDKQSPETMILFSGFLTLLAFMVLWQLGLSIWGLILGIVILDIGSRGGQLASQTFIYSLMPSARNRLNTVYMVSYFAGGALGTFFSSAAWAALKWNGVCLVGGVMALIAILTFLPSLKKSNRCKDIE
mgnify:CR=1 FL=1